MTKKRVSKKEMDEFMNSTFTVVRSRGSQALQDHTDVLTSNGFLKLPKKKHDELNEMCLEFINNYYKSLNNDNNEINQIETPEFEDDA